MDILMTGATGFIGSYLRTALASSHRLYAVSRNSLQLEEDCLTWVPGDLSETDFTLSLPGNIEAVVCLAQSRAYRQFPLQAQDIFDINVKSTFALLEYARKNDVGKFIFTSTANVYRLSKKQIKEEGIIEPTSFYAHSKRVAELLVESYSEFFNCIVLRLFTVYGPGQKEVLIPNLIERVKNNRALQIQGKHGFKVSPINVVDVSKVIKTILEEASDTPGYAIYNVGGDEAFGIYELGINIGKELDLAPRFEFIDQNEPGGWTADTTKLKDRWPLQPFVRFKDGLSEILK